MSFDDWSFPIFSLVLQLGSACAFSRNSVGATASDFKDVEPRGDENALMVRMLYFYGNI